VIVGAAAKRPLDFLESLQRLDLDKLEGVDLIAPNTSTQLDILRHLCALGAADRIEKMACNEIRTSGWIALLPRPSANSAIFSTVYFQVMISPCFCSE
jgi:hypothetical protein